MKAFKTQTKANHKTRKRALCFTLTLFVVFVLVIVWGNLTLCVEGFELETQKLETENGFKIAHISDYHNTKISSFFPLFFIDIFFFFF